MADITDLKVEGGMGSAGNLVRSTVEGSDGGRDLNGRNRSTSELSNVVRRWLLDSVVWLAGLFGWLLYCVLFFYALRCLVLITKGGEGAFPAGENPGL